MNEQIPLPPPVPSTQAPPQQAPKRGRWLWLVATCTVAVVAAAGGFVAGSTTSEEVKAESATGASEDVAASSPIAPTTTIERSTPIEDAAEVCGVDQLVSDAGETIVFDTEGDEDFEGDSYVDVVCVLGALDVPTRVTSAMDSTRALDGTLDDSWDGFSARWNYHPDSGMNLTIWIDE